MGSLCVIKTARLILNSVIYIELPFEREILSRFFQLRLKSLVWGLRSLAVFSYSVTFSLETVFCFIALVAEEAEQPAWCSGATLLVRPGVW